MLTREIIAGLIVLIGLGLILALLVLALNKQVFEAMLIAFPAIIVFRGGISLLRMATASRIAKSLKE
ncbi:MAG: hypothetical protein AAFN77_22235 [Planctomycetota bacterium]